MAASAGTVTLDLDANSVKLVRELMKAQNQTKRSAGRMQREMKQAFSAMGRAAAGFGVALGAAVKVSIDFADRIGKTADKLGVGVEALQEFRFAAKRAGIEQNTLDMALQRFTRRAAEAAMGTGEAEKTLKALGIQLTDVNGQLRPTEELLRDVADAFTAGISPAQQLAYAQKLFDSEGVIMVNMLRDGAQGLDDMAAKARSLGVVMDEELVRNAEIAADRFGDLQQVLKVSIAREVTENADAIIALTEALIKFVGMIGRATQGWNAWLASQGVGVESIDEIRERGQALLRERQQLEQQLEGQGGPADSRHRLVNWLFGDEEESRQAIRERIEAINEEMLALQTQAKDMAQGAAASADVASNDPIYNPIAPAAEVDKRANEVKQIIQNLRDEVATFGMGEEAAIIKLMDLDAGQEAINQASDLLGHIKALQLEEEKRKLDVEERQELEQEYAALVAGTRTDIENHVLQIERIAELYEKGIIPSAEEYAELINRTTKEFEDRKQKTKEEMDSLDEFGKQAARNMQDALADFLFDPFDEGLEGMLKGFSQTIQRMAAEAAAAAIFKKLFGEEGGAGGVLSGIFGGGGDTGGGLGSFLGSLFGGGRALGGPVSAGVPYLVGERGPELVVPQNMGYVIPNNKLGGSTQNVTNVYLPPETPRRTPQQIAYEVANRQNRAQARNR